MPGTCTSSTVSLTTRRSTVTMRSWSFVGSANGCSWFSFQLFSDFRLQTSDFRLGRLSLLRPFDDLVDRPGHEEILLGDAVVPSFDDFLEPADRLGDRHVLTFAAGELLGDGERLRQEPLDLAGARDGQ